MRLEVTDLTAGYGDLVALRNVDLVVPTGSVVALLGANGAGKSTLLSVASGLLKPMAGTVEIDGHDVTGWRSDRVAAMGLCHITEGRSVFPGLSVRDNLRLFSDAKDESGGLDRAVDAFPRLGERLDQIVGTMSGGEQQMVALARAYAQERPLVLLDEVSMGLAPIVVDEIFEFLAKLARAGSSLLLVEQYVAKALAIADLVYIMQRGRIAFAGEPRELAGSDVFAAYLGAQVAS
jgi:branched-chain amino acid transport system ATP-binding protein